MAVTISISVLIIAGFLSGIRLMRSPRTALWGNRLGALTMLCAIAWTFVGGGRGVPPVALVLIAGGAVIGLTLGQAVKMIHMPQTVALLNGFGGAASALVAGAALLSQAGRGGIVFFRASAGLALAIGALTFSGSAIAVLKLQSTAFRGAGRRKGSKRALRFSILLTAALILIDTAFPAVFAGRITLFIVLSGLAAGFLMASRVGGADMPIVISLLNSFSGLAAAAAGLAVGDIILTGTGAVVGVAGIILTRLMCRAMNRALSSVLAGFTPAFGPKPEAGERVSTGSAAGVAAPTKSTPSPDILVKLLLDAKRVIIVPGYGMAVAQAQTAVRRLSDALEARGKDVKFAIHPVAGRMPGHMNVLLAEAGIGYEKLAGIEEINPEFEKVDLVVIIGACDVINPAANTARDTPIYGMPILEVEKTPNIIFCNLDAKPGYSGVENPLYTSPHVVTIWGNAAETVPRLTALIQPSPASSTEAGKNPAQEQPSSSHG